MHIVETDARPQVRGVHGGLPSWFRGCCNEAAQGGSDGYFEVGRKIALSFGNEVPHDIELDDWVNEVDKLDQLLGDEDDAPAWNWFREHYPRFGKLIPPRRRGRFIAGMRHTRDEEGLEV